MYKVLTALAVVALAALGTTIIATVLLHSSISKQSGEIKTLESAEHSDHQKIAALQGEVSAAAKHKKLTAARQRCGQLPQPIGQPVLAFAAPESPLTMRQDSLTAWNALAGIPLSSDTSASGHCG
jgi:hypothetical protein